MAENDFQFWIFLEHAGQHHPDGERRGLHRIAPGVARRDHRKVFDVVVVIDPRHVGLRQRRMEIDRDVERFGAGIDRPELRPIEEFAVGEAVHHRALEAVLLDAALELVGGGVRHRGRQRGERRKPLRVLFHLRGEAVVDAPRQRNGGVGRQLLRRRRAKRQHLHVDAGGIHLGKADGVEVIEPLLLLAGPAGFAAGVGLGELFVPEMLLDGDDRTMRFYEHLCFPVINSVIVRSDATKQSRAACFERWIASHPLAMTAGVSKAGVMSHHPVLSASLFRHRHAPRTRSGPSDTTSNFARDGRNKSGHDDRPRNIRTRAELCWREWAIRRRHHDTCNCFGNPVGGVFGRIERVCAGQLCSSQLLPEDWIVGPGMRIRYYGAVHGVEAQQHRFLHSEHRAARSLKRSLTGLNPAARRRRAVSVTGVPQVRTGCCL